MIAILSREAAAILENSSGAITMVVRGIDAAAVRSDSPKYSGRAKQTDEIEGR